MHNKNMPKYNFNRFVSKFTETFAPIIAPITPKIETVIPVFQSTNFCFIFIIVETIEVGTKNTRFAPCAMCWSFPRNSAKQSISIVPPPHSHS